MVGSRKEFPHQLSIHQIIEAFIVVSYNEEGIELGFVNGPSIIVPADKIFFDPVNGWWAYLPNMANVVVHWQWDQSPPEV